MQNGMGPSWAGENGTPADFDGFSKQDGTPMTGFHQHQHGTPGAWNPSMPNSPFPSDVPSDSTQPSPFSAHGVPPAAGNAQAQNMSLLSQAFQTNLARVQKAATSSGAPGGMHPAGHPSWGAHPPPAGMMLPGGGPGPGPHMMRAGGPTASPSAMGFPQFGPGPNGFPANNGSMPPHLQGQAHPQPGGAVGPHPHQFAPGHAALIASAAASEDGSRPASPGIARQHVRSMTMGSRGSSSSGHGFGFAPAEPWAENAPQFQQYRNAALLSPAGDGPSTSFQGLEMASGPSAPSLPHSRNSPSASMAAAAAQAQAQAYFASGQSSDAALIGSNLDGIVAVQQQAVAAAESTGASPSEVLLGATRNRRGSAGVDGGDEDPDEVVDPEEMSKKDPLATQVWRMYAKQRSALPHGARMENLTWRMMAMTLRKKKEMERLEAEREESKAGAAPTDGAATATTTASDLSSRATSPGAQSRRSSGSQSDKPDTSSLKALKAQTMALTSISEAGPSSAPLRPKARTRFAEVQEEEERGRRGRSSRTPESTGTGGSVGLVQAEDDIMDWRAKSKSRSRSRSVSAMDWRGGSRSRSRAPALHINTIHDAASPGGENDEDGLLSRSAPHDSSAFNLADFADLNAALGDMPEDMLNQAFPGVMPQSTAAAQEAVQRARLQQAFRRAAFTDLFVGSPPAIHAPSAMDDRNVPFFSGGGSSSSGRKSSWDLNAIGPANLLGAPISNLASVPGIADFAGHSINHHPEYGFLPRLVRKTSFDHKVKERSQSRGPAAAAGSGGPTYIEAASAAEAVSNLRKRPYEPSPARPAHYATMDPDQRVASGLSRRFMPFAQQPPTFQSTVPATTFDFALPTGPPPPQSTQQPQPQPPFDGMFGQVPPGSNLPSPGYGATNAPASSPAGPGSFGGPSDAANAQAQANDLEAIMNIFYGEGGMAAQQAQQPTLTHINPNQVFGNGNSGNPSLSMMPQSVLNDDGSPSSWTYSPGGSTQNNMSPNETPPPFGPPGAAPGTTFHSSPLAASFSAGIQPTPPVGAPVKAPTAKARKSDGAGNHSRAPSGSDSKAKGDAKKGGATTTASAANGKKNGSSAPKSDSQSMATADPPTVCSNCNTMKTPLWRRDPDGNPLCNACGLFLKLHGVVRPLSLKTDVIKKRNRAGAKDAKARQAAAAAAAAASSTSASGSSSSVASKSTASTAMPSHESASGSFSQPIVPRQTPAKFAQQQQPGMLAPGAAVVDMKRQRREG